VQTCLRPNTVWALVPADKQEAAFELTQETRDGIPLRFKGIVIFRVSDPVAAAGRFNFVKPGLGVNQVSELLVHVVLGELRHAISHMTMAECIEQRKTTLSEVVAGGLEGTIHRDGEDWGITVEVAQVAQVFIVDAALRAQLEAEIRNEIKLKSEQSDIRAAEAARLASMASAERLAAQQLAADQEELRRGDARVTAQAAADEARLNAETPVRLLRIAREREVLREELAMRELANQVHAIEVEHDLARPRAEQALRQEILPLEQQPELVEAAARLLQGANLSIYGDGTELLRGLAPLVELIGRAVPGAGKDGSPSA
jgi:hypothetical protein